MKNIVFLAIVALFFGASVNAQTTTVDSIAANYKLLPMPEPLTIEKTFPVLGTYQLNNGTEMSATTNSAPVNNSTTTTSTTSTETTATDNVAVTPGSVIVSLDPTNKGIIWIEGLPQGKIKAYLKKSPATYRILAQKTEAGTQVPEGTLYFDPASNQLNIALGKPFDEVDPIAIFSLNPANTMATDANAMVTSDTETKVKTEEGKVKTEMEGNKVKVKTKTPASKNKAKVVYYTAVKLNTTPATSMQNQQ